MRGIVSDCNEALGFEQENEFNKKFLACLRLFGIVRAVRERVIRLVWMQGKDIPQEDRRFNLAQDAPDNRGRTLCDGFAFRWPRRCDPPACAMRLHMNIVGERKPRATPAAIPEISSNPDRIHLHLNGGLQQSQEQFGSRARRFRPVVDSAGIRVWIECVLEPDAAQSPYK
jgi:hypothetical protein